MSLNTEQLNTEAAVSHEEAYTADSAGAEHLSEIKTENTLFAEPIFKINNFSVTNSLI
ncbi:hypothetical protein HY797_00045, partial [Candidatus Falkowbacteria bacterium]|nr:hypothetical protein [Candidatus Falkowbacteria bacterium]